MTRTSYKYTIYVICFFSIGFIFGICYWHIFIQMQCLTSLNRVSRIQSSFYDHFQYRTKNTCQHDRLNLVLTIAILSSFERLMIYLPSVVHTWALLGTIEIEIIIFLEEKSLNTEEFLERFFFQLNQNQQIKSCLFIVKLENVENTYPPQKKSFYAMKFLYTFYQKRTLWLLRLDDNAYVNLEKLLQWLKSIDHRRTLYIGQSGSGRRNGPAIYFPHNQYFCMGGSGVILSQRTLIELGPWLDQCLNSEIITKHEDVELGRCILKHVHIGCTNAYNSKTLFYHHYGPRYNFGHDFTSTILSQALIIHPIKNPNTFQEVFQFYLREKLNFQRNFVENKRRFPVNYVTFLSKIEFDLVRDIHYQTIDARWKSHITEIVRMYSEKIRMLWSKHSSNWTLTHGYFLSGYHRLIPRYGLEAMIEIQLSAHSNTLSPMNFTSTRERFHIRQRFLNHHRLDYREILSIQTNDNLYQLNLIVVSKNKDQALKRFVKNFQHEVLNHITRWKYFTLTILYFYQTNQTTDIFEQLSFKYSSSIRLSIINQTNLLYNRGLGRQLASKLFTDNQILFFLDVDLIFTGEALDNTRRLMVHQLSISSCAVYFPIIFSSFSNLFNHTNHFNSRNGLFSIYGFGNVAVRKKDLENIGGWEINNYEWGNEDVNLFQRFNHPSVECRIFRTVEPGLKHYYHQKMCNGIINKERQKMCYNADMNLFGSQIDMVDYVLNQTIIRE